MIPCLTRVTNFEFAPIELDVNEPKLADLCHGQSAPRSSVVQRKTLIVAAEAAAGDFLRGMELTGVRPAELSVATVARPSCCASNGDMR